MNFKKMLINFRKKGYSNIIPFVHEGKNAIHEYMQYEVPVTVCMGRITKYLMCIHESDTGAYVYQI